MTDHSYVVTGSTIIREYYECRYCNDSDWTYNWSSRNAQPGLLRDEQGEDLPYTAEITEYGQRVLNLRPDAVRTVSDGAVTFQTPSPVSVYLKPADVRKWTADHVDAVLIRLGETSLRIRLYDLTPAWFAPDLTEKQIDNYIFTFASEGEGFRVTAEAQTGEEKIPAEAFTGVTLIKKTGELELTENGVY